MKTSVLFALAGALALVGCNKSTRSDSAATDTTSSDYTATASASGNATVNTDSLENSARRAGNDIENATRRVGNDVRDASREAGAEMRNAANSAGNALSNAASNVATTARMTEWRLTTNDIQADLTANREIVRTKENAATPTGNIDKSALESMVESRLSADTEIANLKLDVDADRNGAIKLTGKAATAEQVGRAIALALDTEGVTKVSSKVKIDKDAGR